MVRKVYATSPDGDMRRMVENREAVSAIFAPLVTDDFKWVMAEQGMAFSHSGPAALSEAVADYYTAWESYRHVPERFIDAGDQVVVLAHEYGRIRGGGPEMQAEGATVWTFRGEKICRVDAFQSHSRALRAAGIEK